MPWIATRSRCCWPCFPPHRSVSAWPGRCTPPSIRWSEGSAMNTVNDLRSTLEKHAPLLLGLLVVLLSARALKKMFWTVFGMYMALHYSGIHPFGLEPVQCLHVARVAHEW